MRLDSLHAVDFETKGIKKRPDYPPAPVGVCIVNAREKEYLSWGHPTENNCTQRQATLKLKEVYRKYPVVFHHAEFDLDVGTAHLKLAYPAEWHDTLYLSFLNNPREVSLSLKPLAAKYLNMPPDEQTKLKQWILANVPNTHDKKSKDNDPDNFWAAHICDAPGGLAGVYAIGDGVRTLKLCKKLLPTIIKEGMQAPYDRERLLTPTTLAMQKPGIRVNVRGLKRDVKQWIARRDQIDGSIQKRLHFKFDVNSNKQLAAAMEHAKVVKTWIKTKKGNRSTSRGNLEKCCQDKKLLDMLSLRGVYSTYISTFALPWIEQAQHHDGRIYPGFHQVRHSNEYHDGGSGTRSGRYSSSDPNLQNVPRNPHDENKKWTFELPILRSYILPDEGCSFLRRDFSAQELRILAHFAEGELLTTFLNDPWIKIHRYVQEQVHKMTSVLFPYEYIKSTLFGIMYGMGDALLAARLDTTHDTAKKLRAACMQALPGLESLIHELKKLARNDEPLVTWGGRPYYCEEPKMIEGRWRTHEYKMLNYLIQPSAADCTKQAMINLADRWRGVTETRIALQVHDELLACCPIGKEKKYMLDMTEAMESVEFDLPMLTEGKAGKKNWATMQPFEALPKERVNKMLERLAK